MAEETRFKKAFKALPVDQINWFFLNHWLQVDWMDEGDESPIDDLINGVPTGISEIDDLPAATLDDLDWIKEQGEKFLTLIQTQLIMPL